MALTATEVRSFGFGHVYVAPVGTAEPAEINVPVDTDDWTDVAFRRGNLVRFVSPKLLRQMSKD